MAVPEEFREEGLPPDPRRVIEVPVSRLLVDRGSGQRKIKDEKVATIVQEFHWYYFEMPTVVPEGDYWRVLEGQHRVEAVRRIDPNAVIRVIEIDLEHVPEKERKKMEADIALTIAKERTSHTRLAEWNLQVMRGDPHQIAAEEVLRHHKLRLGEAATTNAIAAVGVVRRFITINRQTPEMGATTLDTVIKIITIAYPADEPDSAATRWNGHLLRAVAEFVLHHPNLEPERLAMSMRDRIAAQWISQAMAYAQTPTWEYIYDQVKDKYNRGLRSSRRRLA